MFVYVVIRENTGKEGVELEGAFSEHNAAYEHADSLKADGYEGVKVYMTSLEVQ